MNNYQLVIIEVVMKTRNPHLYNIYFGDNALLHYQGQNENNVNTDMPFLIVGIKNKASKEAVEEFMLNCPGFKYYHEMLLGKKVKSFVVTEAELKKAKKKRNGHFLIDWIK